MEYGSDKTIAIVDGYSTGRELARELSAKGVRCVHVRSTAQMPPAVARSFDPGRYDEDLGHLGTVEAAALRLSALRPHAVVAGSEWGVSYAEQLAYVMDLPANRMETLRARRDKFEMIEALRARGLHCAEQIVTASALEARRWASRKGNWPVVVKPLDSASSEGVVICFNDADIERAFAQALNRGNLLGAVNDRLLVQSFLAGPQFIVNTISCGGRHFVTDAWHVGLRMVQGASVAAEWVRLLDPAATPWKRLLPYTRDALGALGVQNGAAHAELKWTPRGPALIEAGARLMGGAMDWEPYAAAGMQTQAERYADLLAGAGWSHRADHGEAPAGLPPQAHYTFRRPFAKAFFVFAHDGLVRGTGGLAKLRLLPSFHSHHRPLEAGARVWRTADSFFCGGVVYLSHDDPGQLSADLQAFRAWNDAGELYDVAPAAMLRSAA
ncbi:hypothetical protein ACKI2N_031310 [Cupriavidus sp. 30B13]|uniref:hypothetical protein n=1 Tax=Cupriavidus sp. 30B13 TaxID=3384241 RepID=UPI003B8F7415